ncbi:GNAT family N-acetyltransferase [Arsukibacterium indicum]|uniref:GNAT family N-acetyltransferase n=1 Tax=Arsukibacterium indicum TaxID=2848612 RepID=A0ABS6MIV9_9GAMM|nr:GNAT family N-acetyltransferase [Arsukibacterium indicum]MBV2128742.1 GNAT family N-acetyltransferase [Arsukibacterium indicum]
MTITIRLIKPADIMAVVALQDSCYSDALYESPALLQQRLSVAADSCWLAENANGQLLAYLFSYPSINGHITPLASAFAPSTLPQLLYLHDMAVSPAARGLGLASRLLATAQQHALSQGLTKLALVAVQGSVPYWQRQGFNEVTGLSDNAEQALASYQGEQARYMQARL